SSYIFEYRMYLRLEIKFNEVSGGGALQTWNAVIPGVSRANSGQEQEVSHASRVWVKANRFGGGGGVYNV
ncbi:MAG: hypothetical protein RL013_315, partial [Bacteroidota bacterium]